MIDVTPRVRASSVSTGPISATSSSWHAFTKCWPGVTRTRLPAASRTRVSTFSPSARSFTRSRKSRTTDRSTSASSSDMRTSRSASATLSSASSRTPDRRSRAAVNPWVSVSSMGAESSATLRAMLRPRFASEAERQESDADRGRAREIAGNVWKIETTVGAQVEEEDVLLILESMKMEIPVEAPRAGRVAEVRVAEGDSIEEGAVLVVLD